MNTQLCVIGGGPGGYTAAFFAADLGLQVVLVELRSQLGGACLLEGCIPSKTLLHAAKVLSEVKELSSWGIGFDLPQIELDTLRSRKNKVIATLSNGLKQLAGKRKIAVLHGRATFADAHTLNFTPAEPQQLVPEKITFEHCIIAVGSSPAKIPALDISSPRVMDSTAALGLPDVPGSLLVIGGGYVGLELGTIYAALGSKVTVVEMTDGLLPGVDRDLVQPLQKRLENLFVAIHLNTQVESLADVGDVVEATFQGEAPQKTQRFDRVLISTGRRPNSSGLGLENTKVQIDRQGFIAVDPQRRTAEPNIFAIGDVVGQPMLAHKALHESKVAVEALLGKAAAFEPRAVPAVVFTDPEIAWAGLNETVAKAEGRKIESAVFPWAANGRAQSLGRTEGLTKWLIEPKSERLLGCGIVGYGAGDLIPEAVLAIEMGCSARDLADVIHPHPTLSETLAGAAEVHLGTATDLYRPKRERPRA